MALDWGTILTHPLFIIFVGCLIITICVILIKFIEWKNNIIDYFWAGLLLYGLAIALSKGLLAAMPDSGFLGFVKLMLVTLGIGFVSPPIKKFVKEVQEKRASYNKSK